MGILATIDRHIRASSEGDENSGPLHDFWYGDASGESDSGIKLSERGALGISTVWKCILWYYKMYGTLPHKLFERTILLDRPAQVEAINHDLYDLIHDTPSPGMSSAEWHGLIAADVKSRGNFYAGIVRDGSGDIVSLPRYRPDLVRLSVEDKRLWYLIPDANGIEQRHYPDEVLHIRGMGFDGIQGYSPIRMQMNLLGWNRATTRYGGSFLKNSSRPSGLVSLTNAVKPERKKEIIEALRASGREAGKMVLIEGDAKFSKMSLDQDEAQFIETMQFQEDDIAGIFEVKPHEIGIMRHSTNNNIEQETISSVTRNLATFAVSVEQQMSMQLLSDRPSSGRGGSTERKRYFFQSELKGLLRGDTAAQTAHIIAMRDRGIYSGNDCTGYLGLPPFDGGDVRVINAAYVPLDMLRELAAKRKGPAPGAPNGEGGPVPAENKASVESMFGGLFRAAVGKAIARKKDREKSVNGIFRDVLLGISAALGVSGFNADDYLGAMAFRAKDWTESKSDAIVEDELTRAVAAIMEKSNEA